MDRAISVCFLDLLKTNIEWKKLPYTQRFMQAIVCPLCTIKWLRTLSRVYLTKVTFQQLAVYNFILVIVVFLCNFAFGNEDKCLVASDGKWIRRNGILPPHFWLELLNPLFLSFESSKSSSTLLGGKLIFPHSNRFHADAILQAYFYFHGK